jgi:hypothetical protein
VAALTAATKGEGDRGHRRSPYVVITVTIELGQLPHLDLRFYSRERSKRFQRIDRRNGAMD